MSLTGGKKNPFHVLSYNILWCDNNFFTFFILPSQKKKNKLLWNFFNEITQPFLKLNLPQNEFHMNSLKTEKNHNKFSSQNNVQK